MKRQPGVVMTVMGLVATAGLALAAPPGADPARGTMLRAAATAGLPPQALLALDHSARLPGMANPHDFAHWLTHSPLCFKTPENQAEWDELAATYQARPPTLVAPYDPRLEFASDTVVWSGDGGQSSSGRAVRAHLLYSFPPDATTWGSADSGFATAPNQLNQRFTNLFGVGNIDRGRELVRQALASWRRNSGLTYDEVDDDGTAMFTSSTRFPQVGDVRIGGIPIGSSTVLAYNNFPTNGSDMVINTNFFSSTFSSSLGEYLPFRNVVAHEHGHGLGAIHTVPCDRTKLMEPFNWNDTANPMVQSDDRRGAQRNYGDRFAGNSSSAAAVDFGDLTSPVLRSVIERDLSTNGTAGQGGTSADWFKFSLSSAQSVTFTMTPTGTNATIGQQSADCSGTTAAVNATQAGNLDLSVRSSDSTTILGSSNNAIGLAENVTLSLNPGTYFIRVRQTADGSIANQTLQTYDLTIRVGAGAGAKAPPQAIAGLNKRCPANTNCWFYANLNSRVTETGALINLYEWDLDADGSFETTGGSAVRQYSSSGTYPITLRVTDSNGMSDTDTITLTITGGVTSVATVAPASGDAGTTIPITLTGTNFRGISAASQVTVSGTGVTVVGTPVSNPLGTTITGLSLAIDPAAAAGTRDISVNNNSSSATAAAIFTVVAAPSCRLDYNQDGSLNPDDIGDFITDYFTAPAIPGPGGYAIACPANPAPYDNGYKAAYTTDASGQCGEPNPDNLGDWITDYFLGC